MKTFSGWILMINLVGLGGIANAGVVLDGEIPFDSSPGIQQKLDQIWTFEQTRYLRQSPPPPQIHFYEFNRSSEPSSFQSWQNGWLVANMDVWHDWMVLNNMSLQILTPAWVRSHVDSEFPFQSNFKGLHYEGTNQIQLAPKETFLLYYILGPYGFRQETMGYGYYSAAHEMLHYTFAQRGIPEKLHHCLFLTPQPKSGKSPIQEMVDYLIDQNISSSMINTVSVRVEESLAPCSSLNADERAQVANIAGTLDTPN